MKQTTYRPVFNRKNKLRKDGTALVQVRVALARKRRYFSTGIYVASDQWDPDRWVIDHPDLDRLNQQIRNQIRELEDYQYKARSRGDIFTLDMLPGNDHRGIDFLVYIDQGIDDENMSIGTRRQHRSTLNHLIAFGKIQQFNDLTRVNILELDNYFRKVLPAQSSVYGSHKRVKKWVRKAIIDGHLQQDPYLGVEIPVGNRNTIRYLEAEQLRLLEQKDLPLERLDQVRDVFLFSCYTGLAYAEAEDLRPDQITADDDGVMWISGTRKKVAGNYRTESVGDYLIPLHEKAVRILSKYKDVRAGYSLPVITNQKYNGYLKEIANLCGISMHLTTHVARHTFATTFTLAKGVSIETVQRMLGHSSVRMTEKYAKVLKDRVREDMKKVL
jgi:site-specific recombinase XerD